jgi:hypothetical protein
LTRNPPLAAISHAIRARFARRSAKKFSGRIVLQQERQSEALTDMLDVGFSEHHGFGV